MRAEESLRQGHLQEALTELQNEVRADPSNPKLRVFLFQLLAVLGNWDRALKQLEVAGELDAGALAMVQTYRAAVHCERLRAEVFAGRRSPLVFGDPEQWLALLLEAQRLSAEERYEESQRLRGEAFDGAPAAEGTVDGQPFSWIADADSRLGPVLEAVVNGKYYWIPFHRIRAIQFDEPADLRDVVWMPVHFAWANGGENVGLIPTRYPGTEAQEDDQLRLARRTDWVDRGSEVFLGLGQRVLATDVGEYALMDVREICFNQEPEGTVDA